MNLLDLMVKIGVDDQASGKMESISAGAIAKAQVMGQAFYDAAKFIGGKALDMGESIVGGALEGYKSYEQLTGGMKKLYGDASDTVIKNAQNAYREVGISANKYMENAAGFSASLLNSVGGDAEKAAEIADMAMKDISDNANTFGKYTVDELTQVYQGLAKGQYQTLDNLNLGIAGTKEGVGQLIDKANELKKANGEAADLTADSFADMVEAIHLVQENMNITGTTAKEAMGTIEGSVNMTKAAWANFLTALGAGDKEMIQSSVSGLVDGIFGAFDEETGKREGGVIQNVVPVVKHVFEAVGEVLPQLVSQLGEQVSSLVAEYLGIDTSKLQDDVRSGWKAITDAFNEGVRRVGEIIQFVRDAWESFASHIDTKESSSALEHLRNAAERLWDFIEENILSHGKEIGAVLATVANAIGALANAALTVIDLLGPFLPAIIGAIAALKAMAIASSIASIVSGIVSFVSAAATAIGMVQSMSGVIAVVMTLCGGWIPILVAVVGAIVAFIATNEDARKAIFDAWTSAMDFLSGVGDSIVSAFSNAGEWLVTAGQNIIIGLWNGLQEEWAKVQGWFGGIGNWIVENKGPESYDKALLVPAGKWIMGGLQEGLEDSFEGSVKPYVRSMGGEMQDAFGNPMLGAGAYGGTRSVARGTDATTQGRDLTVILELDRMQLGRVVYNLNNDETQRVGARLAGGYA